MADLHHHHYRESSLHHDPAGSSSAYQSSSILSEKVARALQVRTDTPAMKAALDALAHLQQPVGVLVTSTTITTTTTTTDASGGSSKSTIANSAADTSSVTGVAASAAATGLGGSGVVDSRSVRVAIEHDALQQALMLQKELRLLVTTVQELRKGVAEAAGHAHRVREAIHSNVVTTETKNTMFPSSSSSTGGGIGVGDGSGGIETEVSSMADISNTADSTTTANTAAAAATTSLLQPVELEDEQKLATTLYSAFAHRDLARRRLAAVHAFLERFDLSQEDSRLLDHYAFEDITESGGVGSMDHIVNGVAFLNALERVRKIRMALGQTFGSAGELAILQQHGVGDDNSDLTINAGGFDVDHRRGLGASSALRMMENLAQKQERSYERLYHWLQKYLRLFGSASTGADSSNESDHDALDEALQHPFVKRALYTLRHVPAFYTHTLELVAASRRGEETRRFLLALTSGFAGLPPIEMKSHDSVAYVGDMLAFTFRAFSMEADVAKGLIEYRPDEDEETEQKDQAADRDEATGLEGSLAELSIEKPITARGMLNISMSGLSRPLKSRVLHVISTLARRPGEEDAQSDDGMNEDFEDEGSVMRNRVTQIYEICGLLLFYVAAIEKGVRKLGSSSSSSYEDGSSDERNPLIVTLVDCLTDATKAYEATTRVYGTMLDQVSELTGVSEVSQAHSLLASIVNVRLHSPGFSVGIECPSECREILSIEWITEMVVSAAAGLSKNLDQIMALKQSVNLVRTAGIGVIAATKLDEVIEKKEADLMEELVERETKKVLDVCGLWPLVEAWKQWDGVKDSGILMCSHPGLSGHDVHEGMKEFYASLYSPPLPSLETVVDDPHLRKTIRSKIASNVCDLYFDLYQSITSVTRGGYEDVSFLGHSPDQVRTLFSV